MTSSICGRARTSRTMVLVVGLVLLAGVAFGAEESPENADVFNLANSLGTGVRLALYGFVALGLCLVSLAVRDAPLLVYLFAMPILQFAGLGLALTVLQCGLVLLKGGGPRHLLPSWPWALFMVCVVASASWALDPQEALFAPVTGILAVLMQVPLVLATLGALRTKLTTLGRLLTALVLGSIPGCIVTIQNALAGNRYLGEDSSPGDSEYYMGFIPPDAFAVILIMGGGFLLFCLASAEVKLRGKLLAGLVLPLLCVALLLSGIRSGWMGFGLCVVLLLVFTRSWVAAMPLLLLALLVGVLSFCSIGGLSLKEKMSSRMSERSMESGQHRMQFWQLGMKGFAQRPILGIGWGCFPGFAADNTLGKRWATHNIFVRVICELGLVGFVIFAAWIVTTWLKVWRQPGGTVVALLMAGVLAQGFFLDHFIGTQFWLFFGICEGVRAGQPARLPGAWATQPGLPATPRVASTT